MIELKPKLYAITVVDEFDCVVSQCPAEGTAPSTLLREQLIAALYIFRQLEAPIQRTLSSSKDLALCLKLSLAQTEEEGQ